MPKKNRVKEERIDQLKKMLQAWLDGDMVQATTTFVYTEKRNEAFARGWRNGIYSVISKIDTDNF